MQFENRTGMNLYKEIGTAFLFLTLLVIGNFANAQRTGLFKGNSNDFYTSAGIGGGSAHYIGDLTPIRYAYYVPYTNVRWNVTGNYTKYFNKNFGARVSFTWARLYGDDFVFAQRNFDKMYQNYVRNLHFRNDVQEFTIAGIWNIKKQYGNANQPRGKFMPYFSAGLGLINHNPKAIQSVTTPPVTPSLTVYNQWVSLKPLNTAGQGLPAVNKKPYSLIAPVIPLAIGFRMKIAQNIDLGFEMGYRIALTDYLDDVGKDRYPDLADLTSNYGITSADFSYRADENFHAVSGQSRIVDFLNAYTLAGGTNIPGITPDNSAAIIYNPTSANVVRGVGSRIYHHLDMYLTTQVTLNYVLSNRVKCPPIK